MTLKTQQGKMPTRKLAATAIATFIVAGAMGVADMFMPGISRAFPGQEYIAILSGLIAGYMTKDRA